MKSQTELLRAVAFLFSVGCIVAAAFLNVFLMLPRHNGIHRGAGRLSTESAELKSRKNEIMIRR
jgi:hypothetical protein